jgi:dTMP kinase
MTDMRGRFITFEGGEGSGKSTQIAPLAERLRLFGLEVHVTREPGGSPGAEIIRHVLLAGAGKPFGPEAEAILFAAARDDHVTSVIRPVLERGAWVLCDRFIDSTRVYQGALGGVDRAFIHGLERLTVGDTRPDLTFVLDVPAKTGLKRAAKRRGKAAADRFETEALDFHQKLSEAYRDLAKAEPERCVLINARSSKDEIAEQIWKSVLARLEPEPVLREALMEKEASA